MISIEYKGRLGNNIYQYCFGRILAKKFNTGLSCESLPFKNTIGFGGNSHQNTVNLSGHVVDIESLDPNVNYNLVGYYQRYEYYKDHKNEIKEWLEIDEGYRKPGENDLVVHVRGGDLYRWKRSDEVHSQQIPISVQQYLSIINTIKFEKIFYVTEFIDDEITQKLNQIVPGEIINQSVLEDFYFISKAKKIIMSHSSLAWWASWVSDASEIHCPLIGFWHPNSNRNDVDTIVNNEERYIFHDFGVNDSWTGSRSELNNLLL
jgi:hypothetical protein